MEASGKSLAEAKEIVLDLLGVAEDDAEFVVLSEPKAGLFGRLRGEARVQARVRPVAPPPKRGRRQRPDRSERRRRPVAQRRGVVGTAERPVGRGRREPVRRAPKPDVRAERSGTGDGAGWRSTATPSSVQRSESDASSRSSRRRRGGRGAAAATEAAASQACRGSKIPVGSPGRVRTTWKSH